MHNIKTKTRFVDLKSQFKDIEPAVQSRINTVLAHQQFISGPEVTELETTLSNYTGAKHCTTCSSGTDALIMALMAYDIGPGDAIFTTPFTFIATAEAIAFLGATPVFVDINPQTFNIDPDKLETAVKSLKSGAKPTQGSPEKLTPKGILPVNIFGLPADYDAITSIAKNHNLFVLEDACQSFGAEYKGRKSCTLGDVSITSFYPTKPLGCYGNGGAVFTSDDVFTEKINAIRNHGKNKNDRSIRIGLNSRMDTIQAAVLLAKMDVFDDELRKRQDVAADYNDKLSGMMTTQVVPEGYMSTWAQYSVVSDKRKELIEVLNREDVPTSIYYPEPLHLQEAFSYLGYGKGSFLVAESICEQVFSLPIHPYLEQDEIDLVVEVLEATTLKITNK
jgi:UDP-2-acetamido-2-deoxy-ribo-hexuluronate aminotransferase